MVASWLWYKLQFHHHGLKKVYVSFSLQVISPTHFILLFIYDILKIGYFGTQLQILVYKVDAKKALQFQTYANNPSKKETESIMQEKFHNQVQGLSQPEVLVICPNPIPNTLSKQASGRDEWPCCQIATKLGFSVVSTSLPDVGFKPQRCCFYIIYPDVL